MKVTSMFSPWIWLSVIFSMFLFLGFLTLLLISLFFIEYHQIYLYGTVIFFVINIIFALRLLNKTL